jgi:hypothetical protein
MGLNGIEGPHKGWFWEGTLQGGGVLNDMMCHSVEAARFLLTEPDTPQTSLIPIKVFLFDSNKTPNFNIQTLYYNNGENMYANSEEGEEKLSFDF